MPTLQRGEGVVWIPGRTILQTVQFPKKATFDSSRTPTRGEVKRTVTLKPLDLGALREKLAKVEAETKANDPRALKNEVVELKRKLTAAEAKASAPSPNVVAADAIRANAFAEGAASREGDVRAAYEAGFVDAIEKTEEALGGMRKARKALTKPPATTASKGPANVKPLAPPIAPAKKPPPAHVVHASTDGITVPQTRILSSLAFWEGLGFDRVTNEQVAVAAGYSPTSTSYTNPRGRLNSAGLITYPAPNYVSATDAGRAATPADDDQRSVRERLDRVLRGPEKRILDALPRDGSPVSNEDLAIAAGYSATSTSYTNPRGGLRMLGLINYPQRGFVAVEPWIWI
jgi:hypothetical protein